MHHTEMAAITHFLRFNRVKKCLPEMERIAEWRKQLEDCYSHLGNVTVSNERRVLVLKKLNFQDLRKSEAILSEFLIFFHFFSLLIIEIEDG